ncbi:response regulator [Phenylobacterium sp.]|uniref:hybrid sensor histidine kinase/response regulator n=1 Tax=Phenylobacterium sp. TaxID=1871053 RepID=UPI0035AEA539
MNERRDTGLDHAAPVGLFRADGAMTLQAVNPRLCALTGRSEAALVGLGFRDLLTRSSQMVYALKVETALLAERGVDEIFLELAGADGRARPVLLTIAAEADGWAGAVFAAPERRAYELELIAARQAAQEAGRARGRFLAAVSHELRTPLTAILGAGFLIEAQTDQDPVADRARLIVAAAAELERLVDDVLDFTDLEGGAGEVALAPVDLAGVVQAACEGPRKLAAAKGLTFRLEIAPDAAGRVLADPPKLRQIVRALTDNAVKFTSQGEVEVRVGRDGADTVLEVRDTGPGFDLADAARLLSPFERGPAPAERGFGLGLATVRRLAERLGGGLEVRAATGQGSRFIVRLPLAAAEPAAPAPPTPQPAPAPGPQRVLFAEDNPQNQWVIRSILEMQGYDVVIAQNGAEALDRLDAEPFDLVLMDMQMPVMDGLDATRALRRRERDRHAPRTPVIMVTANVMSEHVAAALEAGADRHLSKPVSPDALAEAISQVLETAA